MKITRTHPFTGKKNSLDLDITVEELRQYTYDGVHAQTAFPRLNADEREFIINGLLPGEYDEIFKEEEEQ